MRTDIGKFLILTLLGTLFLAMSPASFGASSQTDIANQEIAHIVAKIKIESSAETRRNITKDDLYHFMQQQDRAAVDRLKPGTIDEIASLLSDKDDLVRIWAAHSLGQIGPHARRASAALERALKEVTSLPGLPGWEGIGPDYSSAIAITDTLKRINGTGAKEDSHH